MAKGLHLAVGIILLLCVLRTTRTSSGHDEGELNCYAGILKLIWHPNFEVSLVY